jgi:hypothetical protein
MQLLWQHEVRVSHVPVSAWFECYTQLDCLPGVCLPVSASRLCSCGRLCLQYVAHWLGTGLAPALTPL